LLLAGCSSARSIIAFAMGAVAARARQLARLREDAPVLVQDVAA